ncbi:MULTISPECIES: fibronectin type III domain-containing protein [Paenibacillus]|uniref:fibronectin type III domain-containing protein n=1 Tax=Paenibacillus TaxID=44249 RepID=UPI00096D0AE0|nr:fibronectin type III domain-containing protein [Paenibacillus odorifer]OMD17582.1 hypothetical protein BJP50_15785 [Paenibacillus odorifer]
MKKISYLFVVFAMLFQLIPPLSASAAVTTYKGGVLDGLPMNVGVSVGSASYTVSELTDNNAATVKNMGTSIAWYTFSAPQDIEAVIINNVSSSYSSKIEFYDNNNTKIGEYIPVTNDGVETLSNPITGVYTVVLKSTSATNLYVREFNVYTTPTAVPNVPTISFSAGWDKVTEINWTSTGAKAYNVKRSTSATGPFATIATDVKGTSYSDTTVANGTTYYYVVASSNEAGESVNSTVSAAVQPNATKYTGGLLDKLPINVGASVGTTAYTVRELTDNNAATVKNMGTNIAWYTFSTPQDIEAVIINNASSSYSSKIEFYDNNNTKIGEYTPVTNDGVETLSSPVTGVYAVVLKSTSAANLYVREFNLFSNPTAAPYAPTISFSAGWDKLTEIVWTSTGAKWYNVKRSTSATGPFATIATDVKGTSYSDSTVTNGTTYYYVVTSNNEAGESGNSNVMSAQPNATKYTGGLLDRLPINVGASVGTTANTVRELTDNNAATLKNMGTNIAWYTFSAPLDIEAVIINNASSSYKSLVQFYDKNNIKIGEYTPAANDVIETLPSRLTGVYTVVIKSTTTANLYVREFNVFGEASPIPHLTATAGNAKVTLNWDAAVANATGYIVKRSDTAGGPYIDIQTVTGTTYTYLDSNVINGETYYYTVIGKIGTGESGLSNEVSATPNFEMKVPTNLTAVGGNKQVTLKWEAVNGATGYIVKRGTAAGGPYSLKLVTVPSTTLTYLDTNVVNETTYYYVVTALYGQTESANSNEASAKPNVGDVGEDNGDRALLFIMLNTGEQKEYDVSIAVVNAFVEWYENRGKGVGPVTFAIDKQSNNKGPFKSRKDYIIYDKIITFEVNEYTSVPTPPSSKE